MDDTAKLISAVKWNVQPKYGGDIVVAEETAVVKNPAIGAVVALYRSGDLVQGLAFGVADARRLAADLNKAADEIDLQAN